MCQLISYLFRPDTMEVRVLRLADHSATREGLGLPADDVRPDGWREGHYLPSGRVVCRTLEQDSHTSDECRASLLALRSELETMHRETLEIRLATEELWVQLSGSAPPAALVRSLTQIRAKLAEEYRRANEELARQKQQLEGIRRELSQQHARLVQQKRKLDRWAARRQEDIQQQAARLVAREEELQSQGADLSNLARRWQTEQLGYQQEIRRLRGQLRQQEEPVGVS